MVPWGSAPSLPTPLFEPGRRQLLPLDKANAGEEGQSGGGLESSGQGSNHPTSSSITKERPIPSPGLSFLIHEMGTEIFFLSLSHQRGQSQAWALQSLLSFKRGTVMPIASI